LKVLIAEVQVKIDALNNLEISIIMKNAREEAFFGKICVFFFYFR
jgi:hypothetical protein